jgi:16S rRNA G966 N2-methylase RsmD
LLSRAGILARGAVVVAERASRDPVETLPADWRERAERRYGDTRITLYDITDPRGQAPPGGQNQENR